MNSEIQEITVSEGAVLGYCLTGIVYTILPFMAFFFFKGSLRMKIYPVLIGMITYFISTKMCDFSVWVLFSDMPMSAKKVIASEIVAFFEETARFLMMKYPLANIVSPRKAVCFGIGHAGLECWIRAVDTFGMATRMQKLKDSGISQFIEVKTEEQAVEMTDMLRNYADNSLLSGIVDSVHVVTNFGFHIALTLLIFYKLNDEKSLRWLGLAILMHYLLNAAAAITSIGGDKLCTDFMGIAVGIGIIFAVYKIVGSEFFSDILLTDDDN